jgi:glutamine synthetase
LTEEFQYLRGRIEKFPQADAKAPNASSSFRWFLALIATAGIGLAAAVRKFTSQEQQNSETTTVSEIPLVSRVPQRAGPIVATLAVDKNEEIVEKLENAINSAKGNEGDALDKTATAIFDERTMTKRLPADVFERFQASVVDGTPTTEADMRVIADAMFTWARELGAVDFAHWFFPMRGGGGADGGTLGALKMDTLIDLDFGSEQTIKPIKTCLPHERLFQGETDGSSFPNGGLRVTHAAAAFTTWDRSSPPFVLDKVLRIPCSFVTHYGKCIDDKTPLLRSCDAVKAQGLRLLKTIGIGTDATTVHSYLGWEQEFFVVPADLYKQRPDLVNCGRTLVGALPARNQNGDLNYFGPVPLKVEELMDNIQAEMLKVGCPIAVKHNEVAPGQHEMSPVFCTASASADSNVLFMEVANREAVKLGLQILFHEKPFAGINGSGKHSNWSIGTDTGLNFFYPGKNDDGRKLYATGIACLAYGLSQYNEMVRCAAAQAGNDHRLGAQEAPPAIISLFPGVGFEAHVDAIIAGGDLLGYKAEKKAQSTGCNASMPIEANVEDRNRTAPFPFCGNRFEFRAVGSSQNCAFPVMICNSIMSAGMSHLSGLIEGGMSHRDAVAQMYKENRPVIFTGDGYSAEWPAEAAKRGLPNLRNTPEAIAQWASEKNIKMLETLGVYSQEETEARTEVMYENYINVLTIEAETLIKMVESGIIPACVKDLAKYQNFPKMAGERTTIYEGIVDETESLKKVLGAVSGKSLHEDAVHMCNTVKPQMDKLRKLVDKAENVMEIGLYPFPTYEQLLYSHHH